MSFRPGREPGTRRGARPEKGSAIHETTTKEEVMTELQDRLRESVERTRSEAHSLPPVKARERRAQGLAEVRRLVAADGGAPLRAVPESEHTAAMLRALSKGGR
jgi:hypothetical protein